MSAITYYLTDFWDELGDPRVNSWPLMSGGPWKVLAITAVFVYFVKVLGPRLMKNREPFDLRSAILLHNSCLIGFNGAGFIVGLWITNWGTDTFMCRPYESPEKHLKSELMLYFGYCYMLSKIADFADTIFFILRKKFHQASFLHVFHHALMPWGMWTGLRVHPYPFSGFMAIINTLVHTVMYSYYALACAGSEMRRFLWWKKYITQLQLLQFVLIFMHGVFGLVNKECNFPIGLAVMESFYAAFFFVLFFRFYRRAYLSSKVDKNQNEKIN
ncbi:elongation of very long chain fatty acids protein-like isoform X1 [Dinothrombium tinctorium]|uniref:Elongation of very long chain fatty acids protein n=1 Tax=Dinothrombium tinctorium TaxID=1965070 RepID=A0A3S3R0U6_9ACAR|nr:elongation of very long chain fatty acids protein-like isoform X1 [Dinothrombium tinctorium]RWS17391.1 elongation of very long chain fatty acids protein-like isoform X1 [Dinothrombium tinctorium]RWS17392.1 elongation of very long chain fatty acids protein-like isoform X1 [Dinothrombium tinctorium]